MRDPFRQLTTEAELRAAWRRLARRHHPDANPGDPTAEERFKRLHAAFRAQARRLREGDVFRPREAVRPAPAPPPGPPPAPLACPACGDGYTAGERCPRCDVPLAAHGAHAAAPEDPRVAAFEAELARPRRSWSFPVPVEQRPALAAVGLLAFAAFHWRIGLTPCALMLVGFAAATAVLDGIERYRRARPTLWTREARF